MDYPKRFMSITELTELGHSRMALNQYAHAKGSPVIRTSNKPKSKILFDTSKLDKWLSDNFAVLNS